MLLCTAISCVSLLCRDTISGYGIHSHEKKMVLISVYLHHITVLTATAVYSSYQ